MLFCFHLLFPEYGNCLLIFKNHSVLKRSCLMLCRMFSLCWEYCTGCVFLWLMRLLWFTFRSVVSRYFQGCSDCNITFCSLNAKVQCFPRLILCISFHVLFADTQCSLMAAFRSPTWTCRMRESTSALPQMMLEKPTLQSHWKLTVSTSFFLFLSYHWLFICIIGVCT